MRARLAERFPELTSRLQEESGQTCPQPQRYDQADARILSSCEPGHRGLLRRRAAGKRKPRRAARPERPVSLPDIRSRAQQVQSSYPDEFPDSSPASPLSTGISPEPRVDSARVMGQPEAVKAVLEETVRFGGDQGSARASGRANARETHVSHSETKVRPLAKETRKQHNHDRQIAVAQTTWKSRQSEVQTNSRSQSQSSFMTLETGVFFANIATGMSPERQGYEARLRNF